MYALWKSVEFSFGLERKVILHQQPPDMLIHEDILTHCGLMTDLYPRERIQCSERDRENAEQRLHFPPVPALSSVI
jgi:hypothetical protein